MDRVSLAIDDLKDASPKPKDKAVHTALGELKNILAVLKSSSSKSPARLCEVFGPKLAALYPAFPIPMCQFCVAVLTTVFQEKVKPACEAEDFKLQFAWETALKAVVSSVFVRPSTLRTDPSLTSMKDFIEQSASSSAKAGAGTVLYPAICAMFYPPGTMFKWRSISLIFNVNLLLAESATRHQDNQSRLRMETLLGPTRLGRAISQTKDFFVLDSLLALIGVLLPPLRPSAAKRTEFVDAIFTPELFPRSAAQIKALIAASPGKDWDPVCAQIINECLAKSDLSFPQPFHITGLRTSTPLPNVIDPLYIDNLGLFANVEKDEILHSYQVYFTSMERIKFGGPGGASTSVSIELSAEPLIGPGSEVDIVQKKCTMQFHVKSADAGRFSQTLKARGLGKLISDTKVSKLPEALALNFDSSAVEPATQVSERVAKVEQLWQSDAGPGEPTSPLVANSFRKETPSAGNSGSQEPSSQHEAIYGDDLSDMSDDEKTTSKAKAKTPAPRAPPTPPAAAATSSSSRHRVRIILDSDEEDDAAVKQQPRKALPRKSAMKKLAVESEEEVDESQSPPSSNAKDQDFEPTQEPAGGRAPARVTRGAAKKNPALVAPTEDPSKSKLVPARSKASAAGPRDADVDATKSIRRPAGRKSSFVGQELSASEDEIETTTKARETDKVMTKAKSESTKDSKSGRKRGKAEDEQDDPEDEEADRRPAKRSRADDVVPEEPVLPPRRVSAALFGAANAPAKKRYGGKKGRTSSPGPDGDTDTDMAVDYDELPAPPSPPAPVAEKKPTKAAKVEAGAGDARKSRVAAMKGKAGQKPVAKPEPAVKAPPKSSKAAPTGKNKPKTQMQTTSAALEENADVSDDEVKPTRRSTRATNAAYKTAEPMEVDIPKAKAKSAKPQKAPWEDMHLRNKDEDMATSDEPPAGQDEPMPAPDEPPEGSDTYEEYFVPLKGSTDSALVPQDDVTMLDLTHDASPKRKIVQVEKIIPAPFVDSPSALPIRVVSTPALPAKSPALPVNPVPAFLANPVPVVRTKFQSALRLDSPDPVPTVNLKSAGLTTPIRPQTHTPVAQPERVLPPPMTKFQSEVPSRSTKLVSLLQKEASPSPRQTSSAPVRPNKTLTPVPPSPVHQRLSPRSPALPAHRNKVTNDSPFPERVHHTVAFAPSKPSPSLSAQRHAPSIPARRMINTHAYESTSDLGRPARTFGRAPHKQETDRARDHKRNRTPVEAIVEVLSEIQETCASGEIAFFEELRQALRSKRHSEGHFNNLVDLQEEYAAYHRKIILGIVDMQESAEVMSNTLGQIIQHHDRHSLSKKLPTTMFKLPPILRKPVLSL
ncbi:hypothetical protein DFH06DRAFT_1443094 [Mycena polygramma]|nr:hypothetical protein DFH06DRAFT_1443094 [Mycena polygramma]